MCNFFLFLRFKRNLKLVNNDNICKMRKIEEAESYFNKAIKAYEREDYIFARKCFERAIQHNPKLAKAYNGLAILFKTNFQDYEAAKVHFEKAIVLDPDYARAYHNLANLLIGYFQDYETAKKYYEKAIELDGSIFKAYNNLANILQDNFQDYETAKKYYEKAIELDSNYALAYNNLAVLLFVNFEDSGKAHEYLMLAIEKQAQYDLARKNLRKISNSYSPTFISEFEIKNVRQHKNLKIQLSDNKRQHLFLTGENGSGKSSILKEAENYMQGVLKMPINEIFTEKGKREFWQDEGDYKLKFNVKQNLLELRTKYEAGDFVIVFFDDERKFEPDIPTSIDKVDLQLKNLPKDNVSKDFVKYLIHRDYMMKSNQKSEDIKGLFLKIETILKEIYKEENLVFELDAEELNFYITLPNSNKFNFNELSSGYSAIFKIVFEIILRTRNKEKQTDTEGIILIDEPETHLHIEMQKEIMPILIKMFPNVQFIVATHSPFVLNSVANTVIYDLEKHTTIKDGLFGVSYEGIVESYFGQEEYSNEIVKKIKRYRDLVIKDNASDDEKDELIDLRIDLKDTIKTPWLSPSLASEFNELERVRKSKKG